MDPIEENRIKFLDRSSLYRSFFFGFFFKFCTTLLIVVLNQMKIGRNLCFGKQEREMGTSLRDATEPETGRDCCSVHLEYSCSSFSLDVVCELLKVISVCLRGAEYFQKWISIWVSDLCLHYPYYPYYISFSHKQLTDYLRSKSCLPLITT